MAELGIGIDQSITSTGHAIFRDGQLFKYNTIKTTPDMALIDRHQTTLRGLLSEISKYHVRYAAIEDYAYHHFARQPKTAAKLCELGGQIKMGLVKQNMTVFIVNTTYVKQWVGLLSKVKKKDVVLAVNSQYGTKFKLKDNDIADATILAHVADACWLRLNGLPYPDNYVNGVQRGIVEAILGNQENVLNPPLLGK